MNKMLKKIMVFFILLCVILLAVVLIELFIINRGVERVDDDNSSLTVVSTPPEGPTESGAPVESQSPDVSTPPPSQSPDVSEPPVTTSPDVSEPPVGGTPFDLQIPGGTISLVADELLFAHNMLDMSDEFVYISPDGNASLEIAFIQGVTAEAEAPGFLDNYIDHTELSTPGMSIIGDTNIRGESVIATDGTVTYEAWLVDMSEGFVAIVINYQNEEQEHALYKVLNTMKMTGAL